MSPAILALVAMLAFGAPSPRQEARIAALKAKVTAAYSRSAFLEIERLQGQVLDLVGKAYGKQTPEYYTQLERTAQSVGAASNYAEAKRLYKQAMELAVSLHGAKSPQVAAAMEALAAQHWVLQEFDDAERLSLEALALREEIQGPTHPMTMVRLSLLGHLYQGRLDYGMAEHFFDRSLAAHIKASGPDDLQVAGLLFSIGWMHSQRGAFGKAVEAFERALGIYVRVDNPYLVTAKAAYADTLGDVYEKMGRGKDAKRYWGLAEGWYTEYRDAQFKQHGPSHVMSVAARRTLAQHYVKHKRFEEARTELEAALKADEQLYKTNEVALLGSLVSLGMLEESAGDLKAARRYYTRGVKISASKLGESHGWSQRQLLISVDEKEGRWKQAAKALKEMIKVYAKTYGPEHQVMSPLLLRLGMIRWAMGDVPGAVKWLGKSEAAAEKQLQVSLKTGTESDRQSVLDRFAYHMPVVVALDAAAGGHKGATELALSTVLRNKGRLLDAFTDSMGTLRRKLKPEHRVLLDELGATRARMSTMAAKGPSPGEEKAFQKALAGLEDKIRKLELKIGKASAEYRASNQTVTLKAVQGTIPPDSALVEIMAFTKPDPSRGSIHAGEGTLSYIAYVLHPTGPPQRVELGPAAPVDALVPQLRDALADPDSDDVMELGRALDKLVMEPIRGLLGTTTRLLVAPDGALNLVPFAALVGPDDRFLVERYHITYLSSGRDLLRLQVTVPTRSGPVIFADPSFAGGEPPAAEAPASTRGARRPRTRGRRARALRSMNWSPLPGTRGEADALRLVLPDAAVHVGTAATEEEMKRVAAPQLLHVATHGFFLDAQSTTGFGQNGRSMSENPLLRSGLALTGANKLESDVDDGVVTALEASGMDLWGTQLVVLSACETGVGEVSAGEGVYGLRRALVMAGSESQLLSLWQVDDDATRDLMVGFYKQLLAGKERGQSLRSMQLRMIRDPDRSHPFYWASFIPAGAWGPLR